MYRSGSLVQMLSTQSLSDKVELKLLAIFKATLTRYQVRHTSAINNGIDRFVAFETKRSKKSGKNESEVAVN